MAITLQQINQSISDPNLKNLVVGAAIATCQSIQDEDPAPSNHADRMTFAKQILQNPQSAAEPMVRVILMKFWDSAALTWNETPEPGESNLVVNATDEQVLSAVFNSWDLFTSVT